MKIKAENITNLIIDQNEASISDIVQEYRNIKYKLQSSKDQSWYFQKAIETQNLRLEELSEKFEEFRKQFNGATLDELIKSVNETEDEEKELEKRDHMGLIGNIYLAHILYKRNQLNEMIALKRKVKELMPIDYYIKGYREERGLQE